MVRLLKEMLIVLLAVIALFYLMLPSVLPDFIPLIGWLDEGAATLTLLNTLKYYGLDLTNLYGSRSSRRVVRRVKRKKPQGRPPADPDRYEDNGPIYYD